MSQPWIIGVDDLTVPEPNITLAGCSTVSGLDLMRLKWHEFRDLIEQGQRVVEMIDGKSIDAMTRAARESVT